MDGAKSTSKQRVELAANMTPEMCRAIRRQETNSGLDYWRTGFNNIKVSNDTIGMQAKKPTYRRLAQVNFEFPGLFLPNVDPQSLRQKRKDGKGHPIVLNRSKTMIPEIKAGHSSGVRLKSENHNPSKKASVTDLTCLQLADTLLSYKSPFSGVYGSSTGIYNTPSLRPRYVELFCNDKDAEDGEEQQHGSYKLTNKNQHEEGKVSTFGYHTFKPEDTDSTPGDMRVVIGPRVVDLPVVDIDANTKQQTKPQKSILKNGLINKITRPNSETAISQAYSEKPSISSYQLPKSKTPLRAVSETRMPTYSLYPKIQNDLRDLGHFYGYRNIPGKNEFTGTVRHIPIKLQKEHSHIGEFRDLATRKRSVRFNAAHEVREYTPCEPISFC